MGELEATLDKHWPPQRVIASCGDCGEVLFDCPKRDQPSISSPSYVASLITAYFRNHENKSGHDDFDVQIDKVPTVKREIDCTITVNEDG
jgi:hypothetical protein